MSSCTSCEEALYFYFFFFQAEDGIRDIWRDWSSDVCSSDLAKRPLAQPQPALALPHEHVIELGPHGRRHVGGQRPWRRRPDEERLTRSLRERERDGERSEERRVGKECRSRWSPYHYKKNTKQ